MQVIKLNATLRAYSRAPFYADYVRKPSSTVEGYDKTALYVLVNDTWTPIDLDIPLDDVDTALKTINVYIDYNTNTIKFVDYSGHITSYLLPNSITDNSTIGRDTNGALKLLDTRDSNTFDVVDETFETLIDSDGKEYKKKISGVLRVTGIYDVNSVDNTAQPHSGHELISRLNELEDVVSELSGRGGYLAPVNFGNIHILSSEERDAKLTAEAVAQGRQQPLEEQTKVKNLFDGHIWVYNGLTWIDEGADTIVAANNEGVLGAVTGVAYDPEEPSTRFKISIQTDENNISTGIMSVNGLENEFEQVVYNTDTDVNQTPDTVVKRTTSGTIKATPSQQDDDVVVRSEVVAVLGAVSISKSKINDLFYELNQGVNN